MEEIVIKVPAKFKKSMTSELKKFVPHVQGLLAKGKSSNEDDTRIIINDILGEVLGYDKYNDLKTEFKDRNGRLDYVVKLSEGPNAKKKEKFDFVIEAKAACIDLKEDHVNQTLAYCLTANIDYFILTNARDWQLYKVTKTKNKSDAQLIWDVNLNDGSDIDALVDEMYVFSKHAYLDQKWAFVSDHSKATEIGDIMSIIYSDKMVKSICRSLKDIHEVKVAEDTIKEVLMDKIFKLPAGINKSLLKKLNTPETKKEVSTIQKEECPPIPFEAIEEKIA
jgi:predicted type IV restriction endonuclease